MIPDAAVEAAAEAIYANAPRRETWRGESAERREQYTEYARLALESALPHIQAQTLDEAVDAFPLETIHAPDNAVVWMHRRAQEIRGGAHSGNREVELMRWKLNALAEWAKGMIEESNSPQYGRDVRTLLDYTYDEMREWEH